MTQTAPESADEDDAVATEFAWDVDLFARAARDMRLTWRARGVLAEIAVGYQPGQAPSVSSLASLNRADRGQAEGREAFRRAVAELRAVGYLVPDPDGASSGVGERLVIDLAPAGEALLLTSVQRSRGY